MKINILVLFLISSFISCGKRDKEDPMIDIDQMRRDTMINFDHECDNPKIFQIKNGFTISLCDQLIFLDEYYNEKSRETINSISNKNVIDIELTSDENYIILGKEYLMKIDSLGNNIWEKKLPISYNKSLFVDFTGDIYVINQSNPYDHSKRDKLIKFNSFGDLLWENNQFSFSLFKIVNGYSGLLSIFEQSNGDLYLSIVDKKTGILSKTSLILNLDSGSYHFKHGILKDVVRLKNGGVLISYIALQQGGYPGVYRDVNHLTLSYNQLLVWDKNLSFGDYKSSTVKICLNDEGQYCLLCLSASDPHSGSSGSIKWKSNNEWKEKSSNPPIDGILTNEGTLLYFVNNKDDFNKKDLIIINSIFNP